MLRVRIAIIILYKDKMLFVKHRKNGREYWLLPGGGLEINETIESCAVREVKEETGLNISLGKLVFTSESINPNGKKHIINMFFLGFLKDREVKFCISDSDIYDVKFFGVDEFEEITVYPNIKKELVDAWIKNFKHNIRHLGNRWE
ncbi:MAG: NUDIX domain-containing protein [Candidatus Muiribacteriota bacterium]